MLILEKLKLATASEIADELGINVYAVRTSLRQMLKFDEVEKFAVPIRSCRWQFAWKIKELKISKEKMEKYK